MIAGRLYVHRLERLPDPLELSVILHAEDHRGLRFLSPHHRLQDGVAPLIHLEDVDHAEFVLDPVLIEQLYDVLFAAQRGIPPCPIFAMRPTRGRESKKSLTSAAGS